MQQDAPPIVQKVCALYDRLGIQYEVHCIPPTSKNCYDAVALRSEALGEAIEPHQEIKTLLYKNGDTLVAFNLPGSYDLPLASYTKNGQTHTGIDFKKLQEMTGITDPHKAKTHFTIGEYCPASTAIRTQEGAACPAEDNFGEFGSKITLLFDADMLACGEPLYASLGDIAWGVKFPHPDQLYKLQKLSDLPEYEGIVDVKIVPFAQKKLYENGVIGNPGNPQDISKNIG